MPANTKNVIFREDGTILVKNVIASYPHVFEPWGKDPGDKKKFSIRALIPKDTHADDVKALQQMCVGILKENNKGERIPADKYFLRDGDLTGKPEDEGRWYIAASEDTKPHVIGRNPKIILKPEDDLIYPGAIVNVLIRPWWQNNNYGKRINANLLGVQFVDKGERIAGAARPAAEDAFGDISEEFGGDEGFDDDIPF